MNLSVSERNTNGQRNFRLGFIQGNPVIVIIATGDLQEQSRYTIQTLGTTTSDGSVCWMGTFNMPSGARTTDFVGHAQYQSVMVGRYQYVLNAGGHPVIVALNVGPLNQGFVPPTGRLRLLP